MDWIGLDGFRFAEVMMATMLNIPMICARSAVISWDWLSFGLLVKSIVGTTEGFIFFLSPRVVVYETVFPNCCCQQMKGRKVREWFDIAFCQPES